MVSMEGSGSQSDSNQAKSWWHRNSKRSRDIDFDALAQFVESLRAELVLAENDTSSEGNGNLAITGDILTKLDEAENKLLHLEGRWNKAYHAERLMLLILSPERQKIELLRRLNECQRIRAPFTSFYETQIATDDENAENGKSFSLLTSLVGDLQRHNSHKHLKMRYARYAVYKVGFSFCVSLFLFMSVISLFHWD